MSRHIGEPAQERKARQGVWGVEDLRERPGPSTGVKYLWAYSDSFSAVDQQMFPEFSQYDTNDELLFPGLDVDGYPLVDGYYGIPHGILTLGVQIHSVARENFHRIELYQNNSGPGTVVFQVLQQDASAAMFVPAGDYTIPSGFGGSEFGLSTTSPIRGRFGDEPGVELVTFKAVYEHDSGTTQNIDSVWLSIIVFEEA